MIKIFPKDYDLSDKVLSAVSAVFSVFFLSYFFHYKYSPSINLHHFPVAKLSSEVDGVKIKTANSINFFEAKSKDLVSNNDEIFNDGNRSISIFMLKNNGRIQLGSNSLIRINTVDGETSFKVATGIVDFFLNPGESIFLDNEGEKIRITSNSPSKASFKVVKFNDKAVLSTVDQGLEISNRVLSKKFNPGSDWSIEKDEVKIHPLNISTPVNNDVVHMGEKVKISWLPSEELKLGMSSNPDYVFNDQKIIKNGYSFSAPMQTGDLYLGLQHGNFQKIIKISVVDQFLAKNLRPMDGSLQEIHNEDLLHFSWDKSFENKYYIWIKNGSQEYLKFIEDNQFSIRPKDPLITWSVAQVKKEVHNPRSLFHSFEKFHVSFSGEREISTIKKDFYSVGENIILNLSMLEKEEIQVSVLDKTNEKIIFLKVFQDSPMTMHSLPPGDYRAVLESLTFPNYRVSSWDFNIARPAPEIMLKQIGAYEDLTYEITLPKFDKSEKYILEIFQDSKLQKDLIKLSSKNNIFTFKSDLSGRLYYRYRVIDQNERPSSYSEIGKLIFPISPLD